MAIITIARGSLNWGVNLAQMVSETLNYQCISREILLEDASVKFSLDRQEISKSLEKPPSIWERITGGRKNYLRILRSALLDHARTGKIVYHGHAGHFLIQEIPCVLRVRLIAPIEMRIRAAMETMQMTRKEAEIHITQVDEARTKWTKYLYDVDWRDPVHYDLVVNLGHMKLNTAKDLICMAVEQEEYKMCQAGSPLLENACLAARVMAFLSIHRETETLDISVKADQGAILLEGNIESDDLRSVIVNIASNVEGVKSVRDEMVKQKISPIPT